MITNVFKIILLSEIIKTKEHISYSYHKKTDSFILYFNSFLYDDINKLPFLSIKSDKDLLNYNSELIIKDVSNNIKEVIDFHNETNYFYDNTDKQMIIKEAKLTINEFLLNLGKKLEKYKGEIK